MPPTSTLRPRRSATLAAKVKNSRLRPGTKVFGRPPAFISISRSLVSAVSDDLAEQRQVEQVVVAEPRAPARKLAAQLRAHVQPALELDVVALAVVEADRLDVGVALERPGQADGRVLTAGEQDQRAARVSSPRSSPWPSTTHFSEVRPSRPTGPRACSLSVEMPISAPRPYSKPSAKRVEALTMTLAESTSRRKRIACGVVGR